MIILKPKFQPNFYENLYRRWRGIKETHTLSEIVNVALDMFVNDLGYQRAVVFIHEDATGLFKALFHRGYESSADLAMLRIVQALLSGDVVEAMRHNVEPLIHTIENSAPPVEPLLKQIKMEEALLSTFGGDADVPYGFVVVGNTYASTAQQPVREHQSLVALNNLIIHLSHAVNSSTFFHAWSQEKKHLNLNIELRTQEILAQKQQFEAIFQNSKDGIAILDVHTTAFLDANPAFLELTGYTRTELLRTSCMALTAPYHLSASEEAFGKVLTDGHVIDFMKNCVVAGNRQVTVNMSMALMRDRQHILISAKDMTQRYILERELLEAKNKAEAAQVELAIQNQTLEELATTLENKVAIRTLELEQALKHATAATVAKTQFLATISHEIRTPMNGVLGMTELLANSSLTDEQRQLLRILQSSGRTLLTLIDDILDFSKIEVGKLDLESIPFNLHDLLNDLKDTFTIQAQSRGLDLKLSSMQDLPVCIKGDPTRLRQVFSNLIANAIKFTHKGHIAIDVRRTGNLNEFEVSIQDTGIGICANVQARLFTAFMQANSSTTREFGGTGLGLVISSMLVQLMGGSIWLESEQDRGSVFRFTFLAESITETLTSAKQLDEPAIDMSHLRVLLAEDHQINRLLVTKILKRVNITPILACDGVEVLDRLKDQSYDVILMDLQMPNMDGITATRQIRADKDLEQPYIIALTANAFAEDRVNCYEAGMNDFISKPISIEGLVNALKKVTPSSKLG